MEVIKLANTLHPDLVDGRVKFCCYLSNDCDSDIYPAIKAWANDSESVEISIEFDIGLALDSAIALHEMPAYDKAIDSAAKPMFDAMRSELVAMIEQIDVLKFATPNALNSVAQSAGMNR